ncbi:YrhK family protein [Bacillus suaedae]|uniref:YrhK family protein n=1 Tax=Halalkalibacter suaedae TaxID=2822140 RepID=A0A941AM99_9BACI|nr:YrhK family protein [Bacillus suaedae]MBP3950275.1 YrhK family protein [Bacillus suaedae]
MRYNNEIDIPLGKNETIVIKKRYEFFYHLNDVIIALLFLVGSIFFLSSETKEQGIWLFIIGSALFVIRPFIQFLKMFHLKRRNSQSK